MRSPQATLGRLPAFESRNTPFQMLLGLLHAGSRLDGLLERHAPASPAALDAPPALVDPDLLAVLLGAISISRGVTRLLDGAAHDPADGTGLAVVVDLPPSPRPRDLLR